MKNDIEGKTVSHYTSFDTFQNYIIEDDQIKFSTFLKTNDPFEYKKRIRVATSNAFDHDIIKVNLLAEKILSNNIKVFCTTRAKQIKRDSNSWWFMNIKASDCSFGNVNMWAHYGKGKIDFKNQEKLSHAGICIVFDKKKLSNLTEQKFLFNISKNIVYKEKEENDKNSILIEESDPTRAIIEYYIENHESLFFQKNWDWNAEREYRLLIICDSDKEIKINLKNSIKAVVLGERVDKEISRIKRFCNKKEVNLFQMNWDDIGQNFYIEEVNIS